MTKFSNCARRCRLLLGLLCLSLAAACTRQTDSTRSHLLQIDTPDKGYLNYPVSFLDRSVSEALTFDPKSDPPARISYRLTRDGVVRIRVCWRADKTLVLRTLLDWTRQEFGAHQVQWDGRDASGNVLQNRGCLIAFETHEPEHRNHDPGDCVEPLLNISSPASVRDLSEIKVEITRGSSVERRRGWDVRSYADYQMVSKISLPGSARRFALPTCVGLPEGEHLITVNLDDGAGHVGTAGIKIGLDNPVPVLSKGRTIFNDRGCAKCHDFGTTKRTRETAGLQWIGSRRPEQYLRAAIADPRSLNRTARMPKIPLQEKELEQIVKSLLLLRRPIAAPRTGEEIYEQEGCGDCHETSSQQGSMLGPDLRGAVATRSTHYLREVIVNPQKYYPQTSMPPTVLSDPEFDNLVSHLRSRGASCPLPPKP